MVIMAMKNITATASALIDVTGVILPAFWAFAPDNHFYLLNVGIKIKSTVENSLFNYTINLTKI